jgi:hypothetical protein
MFAFGQGATDRKEQAQPSQGQAQPKGAQGAQREQSNRPSTSGQGQREPSGQGQREQQPKGAQREQPNQPSTSGQGQREQEPKGATSGQAPREEQNRAQGQNQQRERTQGQAPREQERQQGQTQRDQERTQQGTREGERGGSVSFTSEQRTRIRETVFNERNAPRVGRVDFSVREGTVIPRTVRIVEVPQVIVEYHPEWRGYRYFIVNDELVIVEPDTLRIVAVVPV